MKNIPRAMMILAGLFLGALFIWPMWRITLIAPQYPDGVTMFIYINKIGGDSPGILQNINILNHYVGMKYIEPDSIPELQYFPYIIIGMMALALFAAIMNRSWLFLGWVVVLAILGALGVYDFYLWEYDYGHNLSPKAPIKIPGASFQPPLFGTKMILNFIAKSYPHTAFYFVGLSAVLALIAWQIKRKQK